jgi:hypothetical protein
MKLSRFRLFLSIRTESPLGVRDDYWPRDRTPFFHAFQPVAERYRQRKRLALYLLLGFMLGGFLLTYIDMPGTVRLWGVLLLLAVLLGAVVTFLFGLRLKCPACRKRLEPAKGPYCPQCGSDQFSHGIHACCPSCNRTIADEDGDGARSYRIRGCTHCGVMLDERGV